MRRLTPEEIAEPNVILTIHPDRLQLDAPRQVEELLRLYGECRFDGKNMVFSVAAYRYREEIEPAMWLAAHRYVRARMPKTYQFICDGLSLGRSLTEIVAGLPTHKMNAGLRSQVEGAINHLIRERNLLTGGSNNEDL